MHAKCAWMCPQRIWMHHIYCNQSRCRPPSSKEPPLPRPASSQCCREWCKGKTSGLNACQPANPSHVSNDIKWERLWDWECFVSRLMRLRVLHFIYNHAHGREVPRIDHCLEVTGLMTTYRFHPGSIWQTIIQVHDSSQARSFVNTCENMRKSEHARNKWRIAFASL